MNFEKVLKGVEGSDGEKKVQEGVREGRVDEVWKELDGKERRQN
jgi:hypothetical protein